MSPSSTCAVQGSAPTVTLKAIAYDNPTALELKAHVSIPCGTPTATLGIRDRSGTGTTVPVNASDGPRGTEQLGDDVVLHAPPGGAEYDFTLHFRSSGGFEGTAAVIINPGQPLDTTLLAQAPTFTCPFRGPCTIP